MVQIFQYPYFYAWQNKTKKKNQENTDYTVAPNF